ncbi:MAG: rhamnulokinase [Anaerolineae bacterium]|jgi:rhamnulokinase|nr:rhamnulokinase [Anaerolineae bacterium]
MSATRNYLALDLGASGGRAIVGRFDGERLTLEEVHRFANGPVHIPSAHGDSLHWDTLRLFAEIQEGLKKAVVCCGSELISLGIDTWGVDYGLLDRNDRLVGLPYHYRDSRNDAMMAEAFRRVPREEIFAATGVQFMQLNTLFQLLAQQIEDPEVLARTRTLLMMPDLLNYWLTGQKVSERTIASTSQALDPYRPAWATGLLERLGIPTHYLPTIVEAGTVLGGLLPAVIDETGAKQLRVVAPGSHDTASAVAAVPAESADYAYLSSGTWSLMGVETKQPVINADALAFNVTNEGGVCDTIRLLKNIAGLWIIQECRRTWAAEGQALSWDDIVRHAMIARPFIAQIDVDAHDFLAPGDMPARIREYCRRTGQTVPEGVGPIARVVYESLALKYRRVLEMMETLVGHRIGVLHIVGGGAQNRLLNQLTADAIGQPVVAGPFEATAVGNLLLQLLATGAIGSLAEGRALVRRSFDTETYQPTDATAWNDAYARFRGLTG